MIAMLWFLLTLFASPLKSKSRLEAETAALRYQLIVLRRKVGGRVRLTNGDRLFFIQLYPYTARSLSGFISKCGLLAAGGPLSVNQLYARYRRASSVTTIRDLLVDQKEGKMEFPLEERWMVKYSQAIDIDFLGVWDTVGALGLPLGHLPILGKGDMQFLNTGIRVSNKHAFHALAIDEHRKAFAPTLWTVDFPKGTPTPHHHR